MAETEHEQMESFMVEKGAVSGCSSKSTEAISKKLTEIANSDRFYNSESGLTGLRSTKWEVEYCQIIKAEFGETADRYHGEDVRMFQDIRKSYDGSDVSRTQFS
jgi:hypothetical protein